MRFLLTGGIGYLGGRLAQYLKSQGHYVSVTSRRPKKKIPSWMIFDDVVRTDLSSPKSLIPLIQKQDVVIHLAAPDEILSAQDPRASLYAGGELTWNVLEALTVSNRPPLFLYLSTFHVYGAHAIGRVTEATRPYPLHPYSLGKFVGEQVVQFFRNRCHPLKAVCVRLSNVFGAPLHHGVPRWSLIFNDLCLQAVKNKSLTLKTSGRQKRNFIAMADAVRGLEFLSKHSQRWPKDGIIHLGSPLTLNMIQVAEAVAEGAKKVLGFSPAIKKPKSSPHQKISALIFDIGRLSAMGFKWNNPLQEEIIATLRLIKK